MNSRTVGRNIQLLMRSQGIGNTELASKTGFSVEDIINITSGRLVLSSSELSIIAEKLQADKQVFLTDHPSDDYKCLIHCMGNIKNQDNVDRILDYIDTYVSLKEDYMLLDE